jgi:hypothetical protein
MTTHLNIAIIVAVTCGSGYLMIVAGLHKNVLERRRQQRTCPSCGRYLETRVCSACSSSP